MGWFGSPCITMVVLDAVQVEVVLTIVTDRVRGEDHHLDRYIARVEAVEGVKVVLQPNTVSMTVRWT